MTSEEAIKTLKGEAWVCCAEKWNEALDMAIQALKQKPCDDTISRQAVIDAISRVRMCKCNTNEIEAVDECLRTVKALPPVTPQQTGYCRIIIGKRGTVTNGDMIKAVFPNLKTYESAVTIHAETNVVSNGVKGGISYDFWKEWWNAPYKTEREDK